MANLSDTAIASKKVFVIGGIILLIVIAIFALTSVGKSVIRSFRPQQPAPAIAAFGQLPKLDFSEGIKPPAGITYTLETVTGDLPKLPASMRVFGVKEVVSSFGDLENAKKSATKAEFKPEPVEVNHGLAKFADKTDTKFLNIETASGNFSLESNYFINPNIIATRPRSTEEAIDTASEFFRAFALDKLSFPEKKVDTITYKIDNGRLSIVPSLSAANLVQVNFSREDIEKSPIVYSNAKSPEVWALVSGRNVVAAKYIPLPIAKHVFSTYPLKGVSQAYKDLKDGRGAYNRELIAKPGQAVATSGGRLQTHFPIFEIKLGYYISEKFQDYLQPVYIFVGEEGQVAYVSAVADNFVSSN